MSKEPPSFGFLFRRARQETYTAIDDIAECLGVSAEYVSEVEKVQRPPFEQPQILSAAQFMGLSAEATATLIQAAIAHGLDEKMKAAFAQVAAQFPRPSNDGIRTMPATEEQRAHHALGDRIDALEKRIAALEARVVWTGQPRGPESDV